MSEKGRKEISEIKITANISHSDLYRNAVIANLFLTDQLELMKNAYLEAKKLADENDSLIKLEKQWYLEATINLDKANAEIERLKGWIDKYKEIDERIFPVLRIK